MKEARIEFSEDDYESFIEFCDTYPQARQLVAEDILFVTQFRFVIENILKASKYDICKNLEDIKKLMMINAMLIYQRKLTRWQKAMPAIRMVHEIAKAQCSFSKIQANILEKIENLKKDSVFMCLLLAGRRKLKQNF